MTPAPSSKWPCEPTPPPAPCHRCPLKWLQSAEEIRKFRVEFSDGTQSISPQVSGVFDAFAGGLLGARDVETDLWGFIDRTGSWVITPRFAAVTPFACGVASAREGSQFGVIDREGNWLISPQFEWAGPVRPDGSLFVGRRQFIMSMVSRRLDTEMYLNYYLVDLRAGTFISVDETTVRNGQ